MPSFALFDKLLDEPTRDLKEQVVWLCTLRKKACLQHDATRARHINKQRDAQRHITAGVAANRITLRFNRTTDGSAIVTNKKR